MDRQEPRVPSDLVTAAPVDFDTLAGDLKPLANARRLRILQLCTRPRYVEELASAVGIARSAVKKHVDALVAVGVLRTRTGRRDSGPVTEYAIDRSRLFALHAEFGSLGALKSRVGEEPAPPTVTRAGNGAATPGAAGPRLRLVNGLDEGRVFPLLARDGLVWRVGRDAGVDVRLDYDPFASGRHAEIRAEHGAFQLVDAFSTNGTRCNERVLAKGETTTLRAGDVIGIGASLLVFQND